jgi:DNA-binding transcriptional regulator GbsR (MarR family)
MNALSPIQQKFILHWGEMGSRWGINRTVAQLHALLFIARKPLPADELTELLGVARSNISNSLRELQNWGIVRVVHLPGDRRDHFESLQDVWEMFRIITEERRQREIEPTLGILRDCLAEESAGQKPDPVTRERLGALLEFFETTMTWYGQMRRLSTPTLLKLLKLGDRILKLAHLTGAK